MPPPNTLPPAPVAVPHGPEMPAPLNIAERTGQTINHVQQSITGLPDVGRATLVGRIIGLGARVLPTLAIVGGIWYSIQTIMGNPPRLIRQVLR